MGESCAFSSSFARSAQFGQMSANVWRRADSSLPSKAQIPYVAPELARRGKVRDAFLLEGCGPGPLRRR